MHEWLRLGQAIPPERFRALLEAELPVLVFESHDRILSCRERRNARDITQAAIEMLYEMNRALCLLNQRWVTHDQSPTGSTLVAAARPRRRGARDRQRS